jgi:hypothetical protein
MVMSISFRVVIVAVCAYAGWQTASIQSRAPAEPQQLTQNSNSAQWADVLDLTVTPCFEDADAGEVMASLGKR